MTHISWLILAALLRKGLSRIGAKDGNRMFTRKRNSRYHVIELEPCLKLIRIIFRSLLTFRGREPLKRLISPFADDHSTPSLHQAFSDWLSARNTERKRNLSFRFRYLSRSCQGPAKYSSCYIEFDWRIHSTNAHLCYFVFPAFPPFPSIRSAGWSDNKMDIIWMHLSRVTFVSVTRISWF